MSSIFKYASNVAALAVATAVNAYDYTSPKVAKNASSAARTAMNMSATAFYHAKTKIVSTLPDASLVQLKKGHVADALLSLNQARAYTKVLVDEKFRFPDAELTVALGVHGNRLGRFNDQMGRLSEAQTVFRNDCLKLAGKATLVVGAAVVTGLVVKALYNHFTQPVKTEDKAPVKLEPVSPAATTEPTSPAAECI